MYGTYLKFELNYKDLIPNSEKLDLKNVPKTAIASIHTRLSVQKAP
jgi:hypothetical protein